MQLGVVIGRFQVSKIHEGHRTLIERVEAAHGQVLILVGVASDVVSSRRNPMDYITRERMLKSEFPSATVAPLMDMERDEDWSKQLDNVVRGICPIGVPTLYGSRDSFIPHYKGKFKTVEYSPVFSDSGTTVREVVEGAPLDSEDFRAGVIYATGNQYPRVFLTVDIAAIVTDHGEKFVAMGRKSQQHQGLRFPGGFVDQGDMSLEAAATRELFEELTLTPGSPMQYIGSYHVEDWRYHHRDDGFVKTVLFSCTAGGSGMPKASDDLDGGEACLVPLRPESLNLIWPAHRKLFEAILAKENLLNPQDTQPKGK